MSSQSAAVLPCLTHASPRSLYRCTTFLSAACEQPVRDMDDQHHCEHSGRPLHAHGFAPLAESADVGLCVRPIHQGRTHGGSVTICRTSLSPRPRCQPRYPRIHQDDRRLGLVRWRSDASRRRPLARARQRSQPVLPRLLCPRESPGRGPPSAPLTIIQGSTDQRLVTPPPWGTTTSAVNNIDPVGCGRDQINCVLMHLVTSLLAPRPSPAAHSTVQIVGIDRVGDVDVGVVGATGAGSTDWNRPVKGSYSRTPISTRPPRSSAERRLEPSQP